MTFRITYSLRILQVGQLGTSIAKQYIAYTHIAVYPAQLSQQL
jgi:hypothetical protein